MKHLLLPAFAALFCLPACDVAVDDPRLVVRSASVDGPMSRFDLELDGEIRLVRVIELDDGERMLAVADPDGQWLALARTLGDTHVDYDLATLDASTIEPCAQQCDAPDAVTGEVLDLVLEGELDGLEFPATQWRFLSDISKMLDDAAQSVINKMRG